MFFWPKKGNFEAVNKLVKGLNVLIKVIKQYLTTERRLVVPRLGVFLTREDQTIVFSELMRRDDGVLRRLLVEAGMNELAAVGAIDRLIFEVHQAIEEGSSYTLEGFGRFSGGPNDTICFVYDVHAMQEQPAAVEPPTNRRSAVAVVPLVESSVVQVEQASQATQQEIVEEPSSVEDAPVDVVPEPLVTEQHNGQYTAEEDEGAYDDYDEEEEDEYERVSRRRRSSHRRQVTARKPDRFVLFALIAVLLALAAIAFGYYHEWSESRAAEQSALQLEQTLSPTVTDDPQGEMQSAN